MDDESQDTGPKANGTRNGYIQDETFSEVNQYPVIGVLVQEIAYLLDQIYPDQYKSFIAASYVKFVEGGGARVVPIWIGRPKEYYKDIMRKINGILFPGGATWFHPPDGYGDAGMHIYNIAKEMNSNGDYFPLWGTCLGFQLLSYLDSGRKEHRKQFKTRNENSDSVVLVEGFDKSRLLAQAPLKIINSLRNETVTTNFHQFYLTKEILSEAGISENWRIISTNSWQGTEYISMFEHKNFPFYGVQFHPEKNLYEWTKFRSVCHNPASIDFCQYLANFFVDECRKSHHKFPGGVKEERGYLIYNFPLTYTGKKNSTYEHCYLFDKDIDYPAKESRRVLAACLAFHVIFVLLKLANR